MAPVLLKWFLIKLEQLSLNAIHIPTIKVFDGIEKNLYYKEREHCNLSGINKFRIVRSSLFKHLW